MTLTTALALFGLVVLLALALQGWWKTRRLAPKATPKASSKLGAADSGVPRERLDPELDGEGNSNKSGDFGDTQPELPRLPPKASPRLDALIDALAPLTLEAPISGELALLHMPASRRAGSKPITVEGLRADNGEWEPIVAGQRYSELQAGVQMANRSGPLNEIEYSEFVQKTQAFAEAVGANADFPDMLDVVARARELDGLTSPLDAQLSIVLRSNGVAWSVAFVQQLAARTGFIPGTVPGRMVLPASEDVAPPVLVLTVDAQAALAENPQDAAVRECTLSLDVPQTPEVAEPFALLHNTATTLASDLDATPVDDTGQPLTLHAYAAIGQELQQLYGRLQALDLAAGSAPARRLFS
jgi:hypothetical protein